MKLRSLLAIAGVFGVVMFSAPNVLAQAGNFDPGSFDPAQIQKRIMDGYREQLGISNDDEWKIFEPRIQKVLDARREVGFGGGMGGMARLFGRGGQRGGAGQRPGGFGAFMPTPGPEEEALQKAIDSKAPNAELKAALAKFVESRNQKQAKLEKAQADLRQVLSVRQEAIATLLGLL